MHRAPAAAAALSAVLVLTACGGGDSDDASTDSETPSDSTTSTTDSTASPADDRDDSDDSNRPNRSDRPGDSDDSSESTDEGSIEESDDLTRADLRSALLTMSTMPAGWSEMATDGDGGGGLCDIDISELLGVSERSLRKADVKYAFDEDTGPGVVESIGLVPSGRAPELLDELRAGFGDCEDEVQGVPVTASELDLPTLGDDSAAYEIHVGDSQGSIDIPLVYAISGDLVIGVYAIDVSQDPVALLEEYAPRAVDKAVRVLS